MHCLEVVNFSTYQGDVVVKGDLGSSSVNLLHQLDEPAGVGMGKAVDTCSSLPNLLHQPDEPAGVGMGKAVDTGAFLG
jgi:hypothetical protein